MQLANRDGSEQSATLKAVTVVKMVESGSFKEGSVHRRI